MPGINNTPSVRAVYQAACVDGVGITCKCGHSDSLSAFTERPLSGPLPPHMFQCPSCGVAWELRRVGVARVFPSGLVIPAERMCVEVGGML